MWIYPPHIYNSRKNMFDLSNTYFTLKEVKFMREKIVIIFYSIQKIMKIIISTSLTKKKFIIHKKRKIGNLQKRRFIGN